MFKNLFEKIFLSDINYTPRFIEKDMYKKTVSVNISKDTEEYKTVKNSYESLPNSVKARYAYVVVNNK